MHALQLQSAVKWNSFQLFVTASVCAFSAFFLSALFSYIPQTMHIFFCQHTNNQFFLCLFFCLIFFMRSLSLALGSCEHSFFHIYSYILRDCEMKIRRKRVLVRQHTRSRNVCTFGFWCFLSLFCSLLWGEWRTVGRGFRHSKINF